MFDGFLGLFVVGVGPFTKKTTFCFRGIRKRRVCLSERSFRCNQNKEKKLFCINNTKKRNGGGEWLDYMNAGLDGH
jgi:hypothetical protein